MYTLILTLLLVNVICDIYIEKEVAPLLLISDEITSFKLFVNETEEKLQNYTVSVKLSHSFCHVKDNNVILSSVIENEVICSKINENVNGFIENNVYYDSIFLNNYVFDFIYIAREDYIAHSLSPIVKVEDIPVTHYFKSYQTQNISFDSEQLECQGLLPDIIVSSNSKARLVIEPNYSINSTLKCNIKINYPNIYPITSFILEYSPIIPKWKDSFMVSQSGKLFSPEISVPKQWKGKVSYFTDCKNLVLNTTKIPESKEIKLRFSMKRNQECVIVPIYHNRYYFLSTLHISIVKSLRNKFYCIPLSDIYQPINYISCTFLSSPTNNSVLKINNKDLTLSESKLIYIFNIKSSEVKFSHSEFMSIFGSQITWNKPENLLIITNKQQNIISFELRDIKLEDTIINFNGNEIIIKGKTKEIEYAYVSNNTVSKYEYIPYSFSDLKSYFILENNNNYCQISLLNIPSYLYVNQANTIYVNNPCQTDFKVYTSNSLWSLTQNLDQFSLFSSFSDYNKLSISISSQTNIFPFSDFIIPVYIFSLFKTISLNTFPFIYNFKYPYTLENSILITVKASKNLLINPSTFTINPNTNEPQEIEIECSENLSNFSLNFHSNETKLLIPSQLFSIRHYNDSSVTIDVPSYIYYKKTAEFLVQVLNIRDEIVHIKVDCNGCKISEGIITLRREVPFKYITFAITEPVDFLTLSSLESNIKWKNPNIIPIHYESQNIINSNIEMIDLLNYEYTIQILPPPTHNVIVIPQNPNISFTPAKVELNQTKSTQKINIKLTNYLNEFEIHHLINSPLYVMDPIKYSSTSKEECRIVFTPSILYYQTGYSMEYSIRLTCPIDSSIIVVNDILEVTIYPKQWNESTPISLTLNSSLSYLTHYINGDKRFKNQQSLIVKEISSLNSVVISPNSLILSKNIPNKYTIYSPLPLYGLMMIKCNHSSIVFIPPFYHWKGELNITIEVLVEEDFLYDDSPINQIYHSFESLNIVIHPSPFLIYIKNTQKPTVFISPNFLSLASGKTSKYYIHLSSKPTSPVKIYPESSYGSFRTTPEVTINPEDWNIPHEVEVINENKMELRSLQISHEIFSNDTLFTIAPSVRVLLSPSPFSISYESNSYIIKASPYKYKFILPKVENPLEIEIGCSTPGIVITPDEIDYDQTTTDVEIEVNPTQTISVALISITHKVKNSMDFNYPNDSFILPHLELMVSDNTCTCSDGQFFYKNQCVNCYAGHICKDCEITKCGSGKYSNAGSTTCLSCPPEKYAPNEGTPECLDCPPGYSCSADVASICAPGSFSSSGLCIQCPLQTYNLFEGQSACVTCPRGYICPNRIDKPKKCPTGQIPSNDQTACIQCGNNKMCPEIGEECAAGSYTFGNLGVCFLCPPGKKCAGGLNPPVLCPKGTYSESAQSNCITCTAGTYTDKEGSASCILCPSGFSCSTDGVLEKCMEGEYSILGDEKCWKCPENYYSLLGSHNCMLCPAGRQCINGILGASCSGNQYSPLGKKDCTNCPLGMISNSIHSQCVSCPAGFSCSLSGSVTRCGPGTYSLLGENNENCNDCPAGYFCPSIEASPLLCPQGTFSDKRSTKCIQCPAGFSCDKKSSTACTQIGSKNTYSLLGEDTCSICPAGSYCPDTRTKLKCSQGYYSGEGQLSCTICPKNHACSNPELDPIPCSLPYYSPQGSSYCLLCQEGEDCSGSTTSPCAAGTYSFLGKCVDCPAGNECPNPLLGPRPCMHGTTSASKQSECTMCPAGFSCQSVTSVTYTACLDGTYSLDYDLVCHECPTFHYCPNKISLPIKCPDGTFPSSNKLTCETCPPGFSCIFDSTNGFIKTPCPEGTYSTDIDSICHDCPSGFNCPTPSDPPVLCPDGFYSKEKAKLCTKCPIGSYCEPPDQPKLCPPGTFIDVEGSTACIPCPAGYSCTHSTKTECGEGTYSFEGETDCNNCPQGYSCLNKNSITYCPLGTYSIMGTIRTICTPCPARQYCPRPDTEPINCHPGTYSSGGQSECTVCSPGFQCLLSDVSNSDPCPVGHYCNPPKAPRPCPDGYISKGTTGQGTLLNACSICPAGKYCRRINTVLPQEIDCPAGSYCPAGSSMPILCPPGTIRATVGASGINGCTQCQAGRYCRIGTSVAVLCPEGYFCPAGTIDQYQHPCPAGTYNPTTGSSTAGSCIACTTGHFCPEGSSHPIACKPGYYQNIQSQQQCTVCEQGKYCPVAGVTTPINCIPGYFCPIGTVTPYSYPCPAGTFTTSTSLISSTGCTICPAGKACLKGSHGQESFLTCPKGFYCPIGTRYPTEFPCEEGTYSDSHNITAQASCLDCPERFFCSGGKSRPDNACPPGFFCPLRTANPMLTPCPAGTYNDDHGLHSQTQCKECPKGSYCIIASIKPQHCPEGTFLDTVRGDKIGSCKVCPAGMYCPLGSVQPIACGVGYYSDSNANECKICDLGRYCPDSETTKTKMNTDYLCPQGFYCSYGFRSKPTEEKYKCIPGHYCPAGTVQPLPCSAGTYNPLFGKSSQSECIESPAGSYVIQGQIEPTGKCLPGYYCPLKSDSPTKIACPEGKYNPFFEKSNLIDCLNCPAGHYCGRGTSVPDLCPSGYFCPENSIIPTPCPLKTFGYFTGKDKLSDCIPCLKGMFCDTNGLSYPTGPCDPGYSCYGNSSISAPTDDVAGNKCPVGGFCPVGSSEPVVCPLGKFNDQTGADNLADCLPCPPGQYCQGSQLYPCYEGYYCTGGAFTPYQYITPIGHFTKPGSFEPEKCPVGSFNNRIGRGECDPCPAGQYCPLEGMVDTIVCPETKYCESSSSQPKDCPVGTYSKEIGLKDSTECLPCIPGFYCNTTGAADVSGKCSAGYYCVSGTNRPDPEGGLCNEGFYCPEGSHTETPCPAGTYNDLTGQKSISSCKLCSEKQFCSKSNLTSPEGLCNAGFYCISGSFSKQPTLDTNIPPNYGPCPEGNYCLEGTSVPVPCKNGTYNPRSLMSTCLECPAGFYCNGLGLITYSDCPAGYYCERGTVIPTPCPIGTFSNSTNLIKLEQCISCTPGSYCSSLALLEPEGQCIEGTYCLDGSSSEIGIICPSGSYCPTGSPNPTLCPAGTYQPITGQINDTVCILCDEGHYCKESGMSAVGDLCFGGYVCLEGNIVGNPTQGVIGNKGGYPCSPGHYCPEGSISEIKCHNGTFNPVSAQASCTDCTAGYFCPSEGIDSLTTNNLCTAGSYCLEGSTKPAPCPNGTYSSIVGLSSEKCLKCPPGYYCDSEGLTNPTGLCFEGYYCQEGNKRPNEFKCEAGFTCTAGSPQPLLCPPGFYCANGGKPTGMCSAGYYCTLGSYTQYPDGSLIPGDRTITTPPAGETYPEEYQIGNICPEGKYCPTGTSIPYDCPPGTYSLKKGLTKAGECLLCTAGYQCTTSGLNVLPTIECSAGFYCPTGTIHQSLLCPKGNKCLQKSGTPEKCKIGEYQNKLGQSSCLPCPEGFFCPEGSEEPGTCPAGNYCPPNSPFIACPIGTYNPHNNIKSQQYCTVCPAGEYCSNAGSLTPTGLCLKGYYCPPGSFYANPNSCTKGGYCEEGSGITELCPIGTFNYNRGSFSQSSCNPCTAGTYCPQTGTDSSIIVPKQCMENFFCPIGTSILNNTNICPTGHYCQTSSKTGIQCPIGKSQPNRGQPSCIECLDGFNCPQRTTTPDLCAKGKYCIEGRSFPCPSKTYGPNKGEMNSNCSSCTEGFVCSQTGLTEAIVNCRAGSYCVKGSNSGLSCPIGFYCPLGSIQPTPCPQGTYRNLLGGTDINSCRSCPSGTYCPTLNTTLPIPCPPAHYCPINTPNIEIPLLCPPGTYCPEKTTKPIPCQIGTYNLSPGASACSKCPAGYLCKNNLLPPQICQQGYYCPEGTTRALQCPSGTYGFKGGLSDISECTPCISGYTCPFSNMISMDEKNKCLQGYYCPRGQSRQQNFSCPINYYCPIGTSAPLPCEIGTQSTQIRANTCKSCPSGTYCPSNEGPVSCQPGFYCPEKSQSLTEFCTEGKVCPPDSSLPISCPAGYYTNKNYTQQCLPCPEGNYCPLGSEKPTICPAGSYCPPISPVPTPCPTGTFNPLTGSQDSSSGCQLCSPGMFCPNAGSITVDPLNFCTAGFYCITGSATSQPTVPFYGGKCPTGHYCPAQSIQPTPCPEGTYQPLFGVGMDTGCLICSKGYVCTVKGLTRPTVPCPAGYYCAGGPPIICPKGNYCKSGASEPIKSPLGNYQPLEGQNVTLPCPAGYFCPEETFDLTSLECEEGKYCPVQTKVQKPCPAGTYSSKKGLGSVDQCAPCPPGKYCATDGLKSPTGSCSNGYYCKSGSKVQNPLTGSTGRQCPAGFYCVDGLPIPCPLGTYLKESGKSSINDCIDCPVGYYCPSYGLSTLDLKCPDGFSCPIKTINPTILCPEGHSCTSNSPIPVSCQNGKYADIKGLSKCKDCPPGFFCTVQTRNPTPCPKGYYCPKGISDFTLYPCPVGTYNNETGKQALNQCILCSAGKYCSQKNLELPEGPCQAGYYCVLGVKSPKPNDGSNLLAGGNICPKGNYCPEGSHNPIPCPPGSYRSVVEGKNLADCINCPAGYYCPNSGSITTGILCPAGFTCSEGTVNPKDLCEKGSNCILGSTISQRCDLGQYQPSEGQDKCIKCPAGFTCEIKTETPALCSEGNYCQSGSSSTTMNQCPIKTFSNLKGLIAKEECTQCISGKYCNSVGSTTVTDDCKEGHYCIRSVEVENPNENLIRGFIGSSLTGSQTTGGAVCPSGHYCPKGSSSPTPCPLGTYNSNIGSSSDIDCLPCTEGYFCPTYGTSIPIKKCLVSYFCPTQTIYPTKLCSKGHFCPQGSKNEIECSAGTYQSMDGQKQCVNCPEGYYCDASISTPIICPPGRYCQVSSSTTSYSNCPEGSFLSYSGGTRQGDCNSCEPGFACTVEGLTAYDKKCAAGYYCSSRSSSDTPISGVCPKGYYCPENVASPIPCPINTYNNLTGKSSVNDCQSCEPGFYCTLSALIVPNIPCPEGYYCPAGNIPIPCDPGFYCPEKSKEQKKCPVGTYSNSPFTALCQTCPPRFFCDKEGMTTPSACTVGNYCPGNDKEFICTDNTISNIVDLASESECSPCPGGFTCQGNTKIECPSGYYCPFQSEEKIICPPGHYCPKGIADPLFCPPNTYNSDNGKNSIGDCLECDSGYTCPSEGSTTPNAKICDAGYYCKKGEKPLLCEIGHYCPMGTKGKEYPCQKGTYADEIGSTSCKICQQGYYCDQEGMDKPKLCPPGNYCPEGTIEANQFKCPTGTFSSLNGLSLSTECIPCTEGYYCPNEGETSAQLKCDPGFYCPPGTIEPVNLCNSGFICDEGETVPNPKLCTPNTFCPYGSSVGEICPVNTYNPISGIISDCFSCPKGRKCEGAVVLPCEEGGYCPGGDNGVISCLDGYFTTETYLDSPEQCSYCPSGQYCKDGKIIGSCSAGFICFSGMSVPNPDASHLPAGGPCPAGFYCPQGTVIPLRCPTGTFRFEVGGEDVNSCSECQAGFVCEESNPIPEPCPAGFYCPQSKIIACPPMTYNDKLSAKTKEECLECPNGYLCDDFAIDDFKKYPCPAGHYCLKNDLTAKECPIGTYLPTKGGSSADDCLICPGGYTCQSATTVPKPCEQATYCPTNSSESIPCPEAHYCPPASEAPIECPANNYCPENSAKPISCPLGAYCPPKSSAFHVCPVDAYHPGNTHNQSRSSFDYACLLCPPGSYGKVSNITGVQECQLCQPGFYCTGNIVNGVYEAARTCPIGYFCTEGSTLPKACPTGTYSKEPGLESEDQCIKCPANTYNPNTASSECYPCSKTAYSESGSTYCTCIGRYRAFQPLTGICLCEPGYALIENYKIQNSDSRKNCEPLVYSQCGADQIRDAIGRCMNAKDVCIEECGERGGIFSRSTSKCECNLLPVIENVCDKECQENENRVAINSLTKIGEIITPNGTVLSTFDPKELGIPQTYRCTITTFGSMDSTCQLRNVISNSQGFLGSYQISSNLINEIKNFSNGRMLQDEQEQKVIKNPLICVNPNEGVLFDISVDSNSYPKYDIDSLLNTNPNFDYSPFDKLEENKQKYFIYIFNDPGTYVFKTKQNNNTMIIKVIERGSICPEDPIIPIRTSSLILLGIKPRVGLMLDVNWLTLIISIAAIIVIIICLFGWFQYFKKSEWSSRKYSYRYKDLPKKEKYQNIRTKGIYHINDDIDEKDYVVISGKPKEMSADNENESLLFEYKLLDPDLLAPSALINKIKEHDEIMSERENKERNNIGTMKDNVDGDIKLLSEIIKNLENQFGLSESAASLIDYLIKLVNKMPGWKIQNDKLLEAEEKLLNSLKDMEDMKDTSKLKELSKNLVTEYTDSDYEQPTLMDDNISKFDLFNQLLNSYDAEISKQKINESDKNMLLDGMQIEARSDELKNKIKIQMKRGEEFIKENDDMIGDIKKYQTKIIPLVERMKKIREKLINGVPNEKEVEQYQIELEDLLHKLIDVEKDTGMSIEDLIQKLSNLKKKQIQYFGEEENNLKDIEDDVNKSNTEYEMLQKNILSDIFRKDRNNGDVVIEILNQQQQEALTTQNNQILQEKNLKRELEMKNQKEILQFERKAVFELNKIIDENNTNVNLEDMEGMNEIEKNRILEEHKKDKQEFSDKLLKMKEKQNELLNNGLMKRQKRRLEQQIRRHEDEKKELEMIQQNQIKEAELLMNQMLQKTILEFDMNKEDSEEIEKLTIEKVLLKEPELKNQIEEYEDKLEEEKRIREERLEQEIKEVQKKLDDELQKEMKKMQEDLEDELNKERGILYEQITLNDNLSEEQRQIQFDDALKDLDKQYDIIKQTKERDLYINNLKRKMEEQMRIRQNAEEQMKELKRECLEQHQELQGAVTSERERQAALLKEKFNARKNKRKTELESKQKEEYEEHKNKFQIEIGQLQEELEENEEIDEEKTPKDESPRTIEIDPKLRDKYLKTKNDLKKRQEADMRQIELESAEAEVKKELERQKKIFEEQERQLMNEKTEEELAQIKKDHQDQLNEYGAALQNEKSKQKSQLNSKLEAAKLLRKQKLKLKHDKEMMEIEEKEQEEFGNYLSKKKISSTKDEIMNRIMENGLSSYKAESELEERLEKKYIADLQEILQRQLIESGKVLNNMITDLNLKKIDELKDLTDKPEETIRIEEKYKQERKRKEETVMKDLDAKHTSQIMELQREYERSKSDLLAEIKEKCLSIQNQDEQKRLKLEKEKNLKKCKEELLKKKTEAESSQKQELLKIEREHRKLMRVEKEKLERLTNDLFNKEEENMRKKLDELENKTEQEKEELLKVFEEEKKERIKSDKEMKEKQLQLLDDKLLKRRQARQRKIEQEQNKLIEQETSKLKDIMNDLSLYLVGNQGKTIMQKFLTPEQKRFIRLVKFTNYKDGVKLNFATRLELLENVLQKLISSKHKRDNILKSESDPNIEMEGSLIVVDKLNSREKIRFDFCKKIIEYIYTDLYKRPKSTIKLNAAISLPYATYTNNIYNNMYYYDYITKSLYIRKSKFINSGEIIIILLHAIAHIISDPLDLKDDSQFKFKIRFSEILNSTISKFFSGIPQFEIPDLSDKSKNFMQSELISNLGKYTDFLSNK